MKLIIGAIVIFIPIVNFAALGYMVQVVRNVRDGRDRPLPAWDNFGDYFVNGLKVFVGILVYSIPVILLACAFGAATAAVGNAVNPSDADTVMGVLSSCLICFSIIFGLIPYLVFPAMVARLAEVGEMNAMWRVGEIWTFIQQDLGSYVIVLVLSFVATSFLAPLGLIACLVGVFITQWWAYLVVAHLTGQLARNNAALAV